MFRFFLVLALTSAPFAAAADGHERLKAMKQLCESDASVKFDWKNGRYEQVNMKKQKYTLTRIDRLNYGYDLSKEEKDEFISPCIPLHDLERDYKSEGFYIYNTCIKFSYSESSQYIFGYLTCREQHIKWKETTPWEISFSCQNSHGEKVLDFTPNESFHRYYLHSDTRANPGASRPDGKDYKHSMSLSVGRCSSILE